MLYFCIYALALYHTLSSRHCRKAALATVLSFVVIEEPAHPLKVSFCVPLTALASVREIE